MNLRGRPAIRSKLSGLLSQVQSLRYELKQLAADHAGISINNLALSCAHKINTTK